jgi:hypothetical protein
MPLIAIGDVSQPRPDAFANETIGATIFKDLLQ